jgi:hypothetical protein
VFERFTDQARQVVVLAQEEARTLKHNYIGTEHILLGLLREADGLAARVLESLEITLEGTRTQVTRIVGSGEEVTSGQIPFTPRTKEVLELALREALSLGHNYIGTEHVLLGIVRENEGVAARILLDFGASAEMIRDEVIGLLSGPTAWGGATVAGQSRDPRRAVNAGWLDGLGPLLDRLAADIRQELGREPDPGDLLLVLACAQETLTARALSELGVELDALWGTIEHVRQQNSGAREDLTRRIQDVRVAKEQAIEAQEFQSAARLRDQERELREQARAQSAVRPEVLQEIRRHLGIPTSPGDAARPPESA